MPLEIKELHIRVAINENEAERGTSADEGALNKEEVVQLAVEKVFEILQEKEER